MVESNRASCSVPVAYMTERLATNILTSMPTLAQPAVHVYVVQADVHEHAHSYCA